MVKNTKSSKSSTTSQEWVPDLVTDIEEVCRTRADHDEASFGNKTDHANLEQGHMVPGSQPTSVPHMAFLLTTTTPILAMRSSSSASPAVRTLLGRLLELSTPWGF